MKKILLTSLIALGAIAMVNGQVVYKEGFTTGGVDPLTNAYFGTSAEYTTTRAAAGDGSNICTLDKLATSGTYKSIAYEFYTNPENNQTPPTPKTKFTSIDISGTGINKKDTIFVIARSKDLATLRIETKDVLGYTGNFGVSANEFTLTANFALYKFIMETPKDRYTICGGGNVTAPCPDAPLDKTQIVLLLLSVNPAATGAAQVELDYLQIGGSSAAITVATTSAGGDPAFVVADATTATNATTASISSSKLYPNPATDMARVELELKNSSSLKVTLSDLMGKEVMVIAEGTTTSLSKEFSVASLNKGLYTVNYFINGAAAKSELLMVK